MAKPFLPDRETIRAQTEEFIQVHERISEEINGNKGYIRQLMEDDHYAFNVWFAAKFLETIRPKARYYCEMFHDRKFTEEDIKHLGSLENPHWWNGIPLSIGSALMEGMEVSTS